MKQYRYKNAIIRVRGEVNREKIEEATIIFLKKRMQKEKKNGNKDKTGDIKKS